MKKTGSEKRKKAKLIRKTAANILIAAMVFTLAFSAGSVPVSAVTNYSVWIGGTRITSENCKSNTKWQYENSTRTLTLNGYTYTGVGYKGKVTETDEDGNTEDTFYNAPIYSSASLNIVLKGTNTVTVTYANEDYFSAAVFSKGDLTISGTGSLKATGESKNEDSSNAIMTHEGDITIKSGTVNAIGGTDYESYGINTCGYLTIEGGTLTASGGAIYEGDEESVSCGLSVSCVELKGGKLTATGGNSSSAGSSYGFGSRLIMTGGTLSATGGAAKKASAGFITDWDTSYIVGGTATITGGSCAAGSYGILRDNSITVEEEEYSETGEASALLAVSETAKVTVKGGTAAANGVFDYSYCEEDLLLGGDDEEYGDDEGGGDIDEYDEDPDEEDDSCVRCGDYYVYDSHYAPVITVANNTSGTSPSTYISPDPELDLYTRYKYVYVRPAVMPESISLSKTQIRTGTTGLETVINVSYYPDTAEIKGVRWRSDNYSVAEVSEDGTVTTCGIGDAVITADVGRASASCNVICDPEAFISEIDFAGGTHQWIHDADKALKLETYIVPSRLDGAALKWTSSDSSIASVDQSGNVSGHRNGTVIIRAKDPEGDTYGECTVTVHLTKDISEMELSGVSESYQYTGYNVVNFYQINLEGLDYYTDYEYETENNIYPGNGKLILTGKGEYSGTREISFEITFDPSTIRNEGTCGNGLSWYYTDGYNLLIMGDGEIPDYTGSNTAGEAPWNDINSYVFGIWIESGCTKIGANAFNGLNRLSVERVVLPDTLKEIGESAFRSVNSEYRFDLRLPDGLKKIGRYAFSGNDALEGKLVIPDSVTSVGEGAFEGCSDLTEVSLGSHITWIEPYTFAYCGGLEKVEFPPLLRGMGENAFRECRSLTSVTIPSGVTELGKEAFRGSSSLKEAIFKGSSAPQIGEDAFRDCSDELILMHPAGATGWDSADLEEYRIFDIHEHTGEPYVITPASFGHKGRAGMKCSICGITQDGDIYPKIEKAELSENEFIYNGTCHKPSVTVTDAEGNKLTEGMDYTVKYSGGTNAGKAKASITFRNRYEGSSDLEYTVYAADITEKNIKADRKRFVCNGKKRAPVISVAGCREGRDYTLRLSSRGSKKIGRYTVTVKGKGNYTCSKQFSYEIVPRKTSLKSVRADRKKAVLIWKKSAKKIAGSRITGYQIQYSTDKRFRKGCKIRTVKGCKKSKATIKRLRGGKKYYFRIRTFKRVKGKNICSSWSKARAVKVKR